MNRPRPCSTAVFCTILATAALTHAAVTVKTDAPATNTLIFRDYNGTTDSGISYNPGGANAPVQVIANGTSTWTYATAFGDPMIIYNDGVGTWDHAAYPWSRVRFLQNRTDKGDLYYWENPAGGGSPFANNGVIPDRGQVAFLQQSGW